MDLENVCNTVIFNKEMCKTSLQPLHFQCIARQHNHTGIRNYFYDAESRKS